MIVGRDGALRRVVGKSARFGGAAGCKTSLARTRLWWRTDSRASWGPRVLCQRRWGTGARIGWYGERGVRGIAPKAFGADLVDGRRVEAMVLARELILEQTAPGGDGFR